MKALTTLIVTAAVALAGGQALSATNRHSAPTTLKVVMHEPGCHWFQVGGQDVETASVAGPVRLLDLDENTLEIASQDGLRYVHVGKSIVLGRGRYVVMMVGQAVDDNYLKLTVR
jgi:hypothetical protein